MPPRSKATTTKVKGSVALTPNSRFAIKRVKAMAAITPMATTRRIIANQFVRDLRQRQENRWRGIFIEAELLGVCDDADNLARRVKRAASNRQLFFKRILFFVKPPREGFVDNDNRLRARFVRFGKRATLL